MLRASQTPKVLKQLGLSVSLVFGFEDFGDEIPKSFIIKEKILAKRLGSSEVLKFFIL